MKTIVPTAKVPVNANIATVSANAGPARERAELKAGIFMDNTEKKKGKRSGKKNPALRARKKI
jgi:hypothetical protein